MRKRLSFVTIFVLVILFLQLVFTNNSYAQGCSDAGFCTIGAMKPDQNFSKKIQFKLRSIALGQYIGITRFSETVYITNLNMNLGLNKKNVIQIKLPYQHTSGPLGTASGISDLNLGFTRSVLVNEDYEIKLTLGTKIPLNKTTYEKDGRPLPMYYQPSLGTYDLILGGAWLSDDWLISVGYQQPLSGQIDNEFVWGAWQNTDDFETVQKYPTSQGLKRGTDVMLRAERNFRFSRINFNIGSLFIYRLNKDSRISPATGEREEVDDSDGLAWTLLLGGGYKFDVSKSLKFIFGQRIIKRKFNPDGLSRENVFSLTYEYKF